MRGSPLFALLLAASTAHAQRADDPGLQVQMRAAPVAKTDYVRQRVVQDGDRFLAYAENTLTGPVQIELGFENADNVRGWPPLPQRRTLPPGGEALVSTLTVSDAERPARFKLLLTAVPGDPAAATQDVEYRLPIEAADWRIAQGYGGRYSHADPQSRYAVDFAVPEGTPVLAARAGKVMQVEWSFREAGTRAGLAARANLVRVLHDDGSMALYAHLKPEGVTVNPGQVVAAGDRIGVSGNTGFSSGPHLHFAVQVNRGMRLESVPFRMQGLGSGEVGPSGL